MFYSNSVKIGSFDSVDMQKFPFVTIQFKFSTDSLADLSLCSLTFSVLSPEIVCILEKDAENIFIYLYASRNQTKVEQLKAFAIKPYM